MKVSAISYSPVHFNARVEKRANKDIVYVPHDNKAQDSSAFRYHKMDYLGGFLAVIAAFLCLCAFAGRGK